MSDLDFLHLCAHHFAEWGAKWQKEQDKETIEIAEDHAVLAGMNAMKEQMMKDAENVCVVDFSGFAPRGEHCLILAKNHYGLRDGEKVKIIIVKEDEHDKQ